MLSRHTWRLDGRAQRIQLFRSVPMQLNVGRALTTQRKVQAEERAMYSEKRKEKRGPLFGVCLQLRATAAQEHREVCLPLPP